MSNVALQQSAVSQLVAQANAVGGLAQDTGAFAAAVAAFESNDPNAFAWVLQRLEMIPQCELICEWIRVKLCVLRCVEVCGPSDPKVPVPELPQFARAITQLASNEAVLRRVVDAVSCGDANSFHAAIAEARLEAFCHLLCRYVCSTIYRRICEVVCTQQTIPVADAALEIRADAEVLARVFANEHLSAVISRAAVALDCEPLRSAIAQAGFTGSCEIICRLICVWRCVWVCHDLCIEPPPILAGAYAIDESRKFALAARPLAGQPRGWPISSTRSCRETRTTTERSSIVSVLDPIAGRCVPGYARRYASSSASASARRRRRNLSSPILAISTSIPISIRLLARPIRVWPSLDFFTMAAQISRSMASYNWPGTVRSTRPRFRAPR